MRETNVPIVRCLTTDALGHTIAFQPTAAAPPYRTWVIQDGSGRRYRLDLQSYVTYLDGNNPGKNAKAYVVTQLTDESAPQSAPISYGYDASGRLITVDYPGQTSGPPRRRYTYTYDDRGALLSVTDPMGDSLMFDYLEDDVDTDARLLPRLKIKRIADGDGHHIDYQYDTANSITRATLTGAAADIRTVEVAYLEDTDDTHQRYITSQTVNVTLGPSAPQTVTNRSVYSSDGRFLLTETIDPLGNITRFEYNDYNQKTAVVDALGHRRELTYDVTAQPATAIPNRYDLVRIFETSADVDGTPYNIQTSFAYARYDAVSSSDAADGVQSTHRLSAGTDPNGNTSRYGYDDQRNDFSLRPSRFTDPLGNVSARSYDNSGAVLSETDAAGDTSQWVYNPFGRLLSSTDPNGNTRHWVYDPSTGWLVTATDALGAAGDPAHSIRYEWNDSGQRIRDTDAVGAKTEYAYHPSKRLRSLTQYDPTPRVTSFAFDAVGNLTELTDPAGSGVIFRYDEADRVYEIAQGGGPPIQFTRDLAGHVTVMTDRNGALTTYGYDELSRLVSLQEPDWPASAPVNAGKQIGISYDPQGRRLRVSDTEAAGAYLYHYDPAGNLTEHDDPDGSKLLFEYDARKALVRVHDGASAIDLRFTLDGDGRLLALTDSAYLGPSRTYTYHRTAGKLVDNLYGIDYDPSGIVTRFEYDPNGQLTLADHSLSGTTLASYGYRYRSDGLVGSQAGNQVAAYNYDDRKQLISEGPTLRDGYDANGNRLWRAATQPPVAQQAVFDAQNRMLSDGQGTTFGYDANGNLLQRTPPGRGTPTTYTYDGANRLRVIGDGDITIRYRYDADGRMIERNSQHKSQTDTRRYRYGQRIILAELDGTGTIATLYTRDDEGRLLRSRSPARLRPWPRRDPHSLYYLSDGLGSVIRMVDWKGKSHLSCVYDAWGESAGSAKTGVFRYRSCYEDIHTLLLNFGARWYDPHLGRWLSQDPIIGLMAAANADLILYQAELANLYRYALNNPLGMWDPTGLQPQWSGVDDETVYALRNSALREAGGDWQKAGVNINKLRGLQENWYNENLAAAEDSIYAYNITYNSRLGQPAPVSIFSSAVIIAGYEFEKLIGWVKGAVTSPPSWSQFKWMLIGATQPSDTDTQ
jgi:RHS repeat-associated protein